MEKARGRAKRDEDSDQAEHGIGHRAENGEPERRAIAHDRKISLHCHVMIQSNRSDGNDGQNRGRDARGDHPRRKRAVDRALHSSPAREKGVGPKTDGREMITINRATDYFRDHVVSGAERDRAEPEKEKIILVPPADRVLQNALHRRSEEHGVSSRVEPREPEKRASEQPLRNEDLLAPAKPDQATRP